VGGGWLHRVSYRNTVQVTQLARFIAGTPVNFLIKPIDGSDPANCTQIPEYRRQLGTAGSKAQQAHPPMEYVFNPDVAGDITVSLDQAVNPICQETGTVLVVYGGRARDVPIFLTTIDHRYRDGPCTPSRIVVLEGSDAVRLRSQDDPDRQQLLEQALSSHSFQTGPAGKVSLIMTPLADPDVPPISTSPTWVAFRQDFVADGFPGEHLDDGWALNAHDALTTVVQAMAKIAGSMTPSQINDAITNNFQNRPVPGAIQAPLEFDRDGNRTGVPSVVRLCPITNPSHYRTRTVVATSLRDQGAC
jgi:hypothetical protein